MHCENPNRFKVPYKRLREIAKNHEKTKDLVYKARNDSPNSDVYLSIIDGDTVSFNGIYSAYLRIHANAKKTPHIMSTGYEFTKEKEDDTPFVIGSKLDRKIRVATAKILPLCIYIPEPNFCLLVPENVENLETHSFIDKRWFQRIRDGSKESVALIRNLIKLIGINQLKVVFSDDNPLFTKIPPRARNIKGSQKTPIKFSKESKSVIGLTEKDFVAVKNISHSCLHESIWLDNLYINKAIDLKGSTFKFKGLFSKVYKQTITNDEKVSLLNIIPVNDLESLKF